MTINALFDSTSNLLVKTAQLRSKKAEVIAGNIANLDTPGYKAKNFEFAEQLQKASRQTTSSLPMTSTNVNHFGNLSNINRVRGEVVSKSNPLGGLDKNSVNLDQEMADQAINDGAYSRSMQLLKSKMAILKNAIVEGGK